MAAVVQPKSANPANTPTALDRFQGTATHLNAYRVVRVAVECLEHHLHAQLLQHEPSNSVTVPELLAAQTTNQLLPTRLLLLPTQLLLLPTQLLLLPTRLLLALVLLLLPLVLLPDPHPRLTVDGRVLYSLVQPRR